jgi:hypothetical protein
MLRKSDGTYKEAACDADGKLEITGSIETTPPEGGATSAKQDTGNTSLASIDGKLPAALTAGGGVKVGLVDAIPAGTNTIGAVTGPSAAALATSAKQDTVITAVTGLDTKLPAAITPGNNGTLPAATRIYAILMGKEPNGGTGYFIDVDTSRRLQTVANQPTQSTTSNTSGASYEEQRGIDFGFAMKDVIVFSETAGYILLVNKSSDAANADTALGGQVYPIAAGSTIKIGGEGPSVSFSSGLQVVFSSTPNQVTLGGAHCRISIRGN